MMSNVRHYIELPEDIAFIVEGYARVIQFNEPFSDELEKSYEVLVPLFSSSEESYSSLIRKLYALTEQDQVGFSAGGYDKCEFILEATFFRENKRYRFNLGDNEWENGANDAALWCRLEVPTEGEFNDIKNDFVLGLEERLDLVQPSPKHSWFTLKWHSNKGSDLFSWRTKPSARPPLFQNLQKQLEMFV